MSGDTITIPPGAGPGQSRIVIGPSKPPELVAYYAAVGLTLSSAVLYYDQFNNYYYEVALDASGGSFWHAEGIVEIGFPVYAWAAAMRGMVTPAAR